MTRTFLSALFLASALVGCNRDGSTHSEAPRTVTAQSTPASPQPTLAEREEIRQEAVEELPAQLTEAEQARQRATEEAGRLAILVNQACEGIATEEKDVCPIDERHVRAVRNVDNGVSMQLNPNAGDQALLQRRIDCYEAVAQVRANEAAVVATPDPTNETPAAGAIENPAATPRAECVLDVPTTSVELRRAPGGVRVQLTSETEGYAVEIREQAYDMLKQHRAARRRPARH